MIPTSKKGGVPVGYVPHRREGRSKAPLLHLYRLLHLFPVSLLRLACHKSFNYFSNTFCYAEKCLILIAPGSDRFGIDWQGLQIYKGSAFPIDWAHRNRNHSRLTSLVPLKGTFHLNLVAVIRS